MLIGGNGSGIQYFDPGADGGAGSRTGGNRRLDLLRCHGRSGHRLLSVAGAAGPESGPGRENGGSNRHPGSLQRMLFEFEEGRGRNQRGSGVAAKNQYDFAGRRPGNVRAGPRATSFRRDGQ